MLSIAEGLWVEEAPLRVGGLQMGTRMSVIRLADGGLFVHSPIRLDAALRAELDTAGPVRFIVCPNLWHHLYAPALSEAYPEAQVFGPPGLAQKDTSLRVDHELGLPVPPEWSAELDLIPVEGFPRFAEFVFLHRPTRTLLMTDAIANFHEARGITWLYLRLCGALGGLGHTLLHRLEFRDRAAVRGSIERVLSWDFDRIVPCHGEVLETGGREALRAAFAWV